MDTCYLPEPVQTYIQDLERRLAEMDPIKAAMQALEEKYKVLVENANDAIFVLQHGKVCFANPCSLEIAGIVAEELEARHYSEYLHPEEKEKVVSRHKRRLKGEKVLSMYPLRIVNRRGQVVWVEVNAVLIEWEGAPATLNIIRDITSQKMLERKYHQLDSLETVRTLAGGMAHGFNNLLMGIQGSASLLAMAIEPHDPQFEHLERIESCVEQSARLVKQLVGFAQCGKYRLAPVSVWPLVEKALAAIRISHKSIDFRTACASDLQTVVADKSQIDQVLINILLNACQAIPARGEIEIRAENAALKEARSTCCNLAPGAYVKITVRDNGIGMAETVRQRVFEPFFTTKGAALHRGLGMAAAFGIVANHNGLIDVVSAKGIGSTFTVLLPAADDGAP